MAHDPHHIPEQDPEQFAAYVAALADELAATARRQGFDVLAYLLDMARLEAESLRQRAQTMITHKVSHG